MRSSRVLCVVTKAAKAYLENDQLAGETGDDTLEALHRGAVGGSTAISSTLRARHLYLAGRLGRAGSEG